MPLPPGYELTKEGQQWSNYQQVQQQLYDSQQPSYTVPTAEDIQTDKGTDPTANWDWQNQEGLGPQGQPLPKLAIGWQPNGEADFGTGLGGWWNKFKSNVESKYQEGYQNGLSISGIKELQLNVQASQQAGKTLYSGSQEVQNAIQAEKNARKPQNDQQAKFFGTIEAGKEVFNQALWGVLNGLGQGAVYTEQALGTAGLSLGDVLQGKEVNLKENWGASRLAYSGIFDASIREEMNRRMESGIRPDLAAQEIQKSKTWTLWPELIGQLIYDPLNVVSGIGKANEALKVEQDVTKTFHTVENPAIRDVIEAARGLDDATGYQKIDEIVKAQQGLQAAASHAQDIEQAAGKLDELSKSYKMSSLTANGKMAHLANQTSEILMHVVNNSSPDDALEILRGMVMSASKDTNQAAEGVSAMLHFADAPALFSEAGNKTTVVLSRMMEKYGDDWLKGIEALKGDKSAITKDLLTKLDEVGQEMFPSVSKMLEAQDAVKAGKEVSEATAALAKRADQLPEYVKAATRFHDKAQIVVGPLNKFFAGAYMGWSPGYAFRNWSNNTLQMLIDQGPGILLGKADDLFKETEALHGGALQGAFGFGEVGALTTDKAAQGTTDLKGIIQSAKEAGLKGPFQGVGANFEENAAKRIISKSYTDTFTKGVKAMTKALAPDLKAAGIPEDIINKLPTYIMQNKGDAAAVVNAIRQDIKSGIIDLFNDIDRIDPKYQGFLKDSGKWQEYVDGVLKATTKEEATQNAKKIFDDLAQAADLVYREGKPVVDPTDKFLKMAEEGGLSEARGMMISIRKTENRNTIKAVESILAEADDMGSKLGLEVGSMKKELGITGLNTWGNGAAQEADRLNNLALKLYKDGRKGGADLAGMWKAFPELFHGEPPAGLNYNTFKDALWTTYDQVVGKVWGVARDESVAKSVNYLDALKAQGAQIPQEWYDTINKAVEGAKEYDTAMVGRFGEVISGEKALPYGSRSTQISALAQKYGIATATEAGVSMDKKTLSIIKKYAEVDYKSLEEVPVSVAEEAFKAKSGATTAATIAPAATSGAQQAATSLTEAATVPRSELPPEVSSEFERIAKELQSELSSGTGPTVTVPKQGAGGEITRAGSTNVDWYKQLYKEGMGKPQVDAALERIVQDSGKDKGKAVEKLKDLIIQRISYGDPNAGIPPNLKLLEQMGADSKTMERALADFNDITKQELTLEEAIGKSTAGPGALLPKPDWKSAESDIQSYVKANPDSPVAKAYDAAVTEAKSADRLTFSESDKQKILDEYLKANPEAPQTALLHNPDAPYFDDAGNLVEPNRPRILPKPTDGEMPSAARVIHDQMDGVSEIRKWIMNDVEQNFGKKQLIDQASESAMKTLGKELTSKIAETRLISSRVAQEARNFTLLNYGEKSYWDVALGYIYPYHFWYGRTYANWLKRAVTNPAILAHYARYKDNLANVHADMPDWWKYNINTNDLPGVHVDNPLYFNLEATLWPLNGLTGEDFNDPDRRVNWWTSTLDYANKFGPSVWSPINMVTGLALLKQGEQTAGEKWLGRLFPQSASIKAAGSLLGVNNLETDPYVNFLQNGLDPYERRRVQRALANMEQDVVSGNSPYTRAQIQDAAYNQQGPIWDEAVKRAVNGRAPAQLESFFFGVGFKGRTQEDMQIDNFYTDYNKLWGMKPNLSSQEWRQGMDQLKTKYPFMDTVMLSRRDGTERDAGLAYLVMSRIPPGKSSEYAKAVGIDPTLMDKFFSDKGSIEKWTASDRQKFMSGIMTMSAVLELPTDMTRHEWTAAKNAYDQMSTDAKSKFGETILDQVDAYYQAKTKGGNAASTFLDSHPDVASYMDWRAQRVMGSPLLSAYYGGASMVEGYYRSKMYADIESKLGSNIFDTISQYNDLKTNATGVEQKAFYRQHRNEINMYYKMKDGWQIKIDQEVAQLSAHMPEGQGAQVRPDYDTTSPTQSQFAQTVQNGNQPGPTIQDFQAQIPERLQGLMNDYIYNGEPLSDPASKQLERIASQMGYQNVNDLLQAYGASLYQGQGQP